MSAFSAEFADRIPVMELISCDQGKTVYLRTEVSENNNVFHGKARQ